MKRRYNEEHSDAEIIDWNSDDETETNHKAISKSMTRFDDDDDDGGGGGVMMMMMIVVT